MLLYFEQTRDRIIEAIRQISPVRPVVVGIMSLILLSMLTSGLRLPFLILLSLGLAMVVCWGREFLLLMQIPDNVFPGRFDKLVWALAIVFVPFLGVPTFWFFRKAHWPGLGARSKPESHDAF